MGVHDIYLHVFRKLESFPYVASHQIYFVSLSFANQIMALLRNVLKKNTNQLLQKFNGLKLSR